MEMQESKLREKTTKSPNNGRASSRERKLALQQDVGFFYSSEFFISLLIYLSINCSKLLIFMYIFVSG